MHCSTPQSVFDWANRRWGPFDIDVAAEPWNAKCPKFYTKEQDGLTLPWTGRIWCNPPWSECPRWAAHGELVCHGEAELVVMLLPMRRGTEWWEEIVETHADHIKPIRGRIQFNPPPGTKKGKGGFEACAFVVFERPLYAGSFNLAA